MAEVDTSSYPKPGLPVSPLDMAGKFAGLQQQKLSIDQAKLDQANQGLTYLTRAMASIGPNPGPDWKQKYMEVGANAVKMGLVPEQQLQVWADRVNQAPDSNTFFNQAISAAQSHQQILQNYQGTPATADNGAVNYQGMQGGAFKPGFRPSTQMPVQLPPTTPSIENNPASPAYGQPGYVGPAGPSGVAPVTNVPQVVNTPRKLSSMTTGPTGPTEQTGFNFDQRFAGEPKIASAPPPMFEEGKKQLVEDQANAAQLMTNVKPAMLGLKLLPGLATGPGTEAWNKAVGFLKAQGALPLNVDPEKDKTVIYQEANKYFSQYLKGRGGRSDADLLAAEKSSPNVGSQLNPALQNLTRSAIAQDRIQAARPTAFNSADYSKYGQHRATFPQSVDERAFQLDLMPKADSAKLVDQMHTKYKNNPKNPEALKFFKSLDIAKKQGFFNSEQE